MISSRRFSFLSMFTMAGRVSRLSEYICSVFGENLKLSVRIWG